MTGHDERTVAALRSLAEVQRQRRQYEAVTAAGWRARGTSYAEIGRRLSLDGPAAKRRVLAGEKLLRDDPDGARRLVEDYLRTLFTGDDPVQKLARLVLADGPAEALRAAAELAESQETGQ